MGSGQKSGHTRQLYDEIRCIASGCEKHTARGWKPVYTNAEKHISGQHILYRRTIVTHEMDFYREVSDRVLFMADGMILEEGTPEEVFTNPQNPRCREFLSQVL